MPALAIMTFRGPRAETDFWIRDSTSGREETSAMTPVALRPRDWISLTVCWFLGVGQGPMRNGLRSHTASIPAWLAAMSLIQTL